MASSQEQSPRLRRTVNEIVVAEMFLVQATVESATAISSGMSALASANDDQHRSWSGISSILQRTASAALEPYTSHYRYFKELRKRAS